MESKQIQKPEDIYQKSSFFRQNTFAYAETKNLSNEKTENQKNILAIYVSYYVKIKVSLNSIGSEISLKLPFILGDFDECRIKEFDRDSLIETDDLTDNSCSNNVENIGLINEKINNFVNSPNSSASEKELNLNKNVVHAQIHSHKYLESDI